MNKPWWAAALVAATVVLAGCNKGGTDQNTMQLRVLNAVVDAEPLDVLVDDNAKFTAVALGTTTSTSQLDSGTRTIKVRSSTNAAILSEKSLALGSGTTSTMVMYGKRGALGTVLLTDSTVTPASGKFRLRALGLSADSGALDIYVTAGTVNDGSATLSSVAYLSPTDYSEITSGSFKVFMTVAGTKDIVFQSTAQAFAEGSKVTILVFPSAGGKLVNAIVLVEGSSGSGTLLSNPVGRTKAVNAIPDAPPLNFKADGTTLLSSVPFAGTSSYVSLASGDRTLQVEAANVPGTIIASTVKNIGGARDYTTMALDTLAAPRVVVLTDDNSLPTSGFAKIRFVNALTGSDGVDALVNFASQASGIGYGAASGYSQVAADTGYTISFATAGGVSTLATISAAELDAGAVYSAFIMGSAAAPQAKLVRDR